MQSLRIADGEAFECVHQAYGGGGTQPQQQHQLGAPPPADGMTVAPPLNYPPAPFRYNRKGSASGAPPRLPSDSGGVSEYGASAALYPSQGGQAQWGGQGQPQQYQQY